MPTPRSKAAPRQTGLFQQLAQHITRNGMTSMFGLCVGMPQVIDGCAAKDWHKVGAGASEILLGLSGSDRFGMGKNNVAGNTNGNPV